jgi:hypothetical protein
MLLWVITAPDADPSLAPTPTETEILDRLEPGENRPPKRTMSRYITKIARLGGYLARASDPPPGNIVMWRGLSRLTDIRLGVGIAASFVGN